MKKIQSILFLLLLSITAFSQTTGDTGQMTSESEIYFSHSSYALNLDLNNNRESLSSLCGLLNELSGDSQRVISKVEISSYTSPEGGYDYNDGLSQRRFSAIYDYLRANTIVADNLFERKYAGIDWKLLGELVAKSDMQWRDEVLYILRDVPEETWCRLDVNDEKLTKIDSRNKQIMELDGGKAYRYMFENIYPMLRRASVVTIYFDVVQEEVAEPEVLEANSIEEVEEEPKVQIQYKIKPKKVVTSKPLFALKTNLLYDIASVVNVELEVPIGDHWSIAAEWVFPWWSTCGNKGNNWQSGTETGDRNTLQIRNANIEGKYWFDRRSIMTGWFVGLYAGAGTFDVEYDAKGYQSDLFVAGGISAGYAHTINRSGSLRMEYSIGVGYLQTDYNYYEEHYGIDNQWHTIRKESATQQWVGPTKAKVSLVWMLNRKVK